MSVTQSLMSTDFRQASIHSTEATPLSKLKGTRSLCDNKQGIVFSLGKAGGNRVGNQAGPVSCWPKVKKIGHNAECLQLSV